MDFGVYNIGFYLFKRKDTYKYRLYLYAGLSSLYGYTSEHQLLHFDAIVIKEGTLCTLRNRIHPEFNFIRKH